MFVSQSRFPHLLSPGAYWCHKAYENERDVLRQSWHVVTTKAELSRAGDFITRNILGSQIQIRNFDGEIHAQDTLTIGEGAVVNAQIVGASVVVHGRVTGDVTARKRLEIRAPGALIGNIVTPSLVIHEGVVFEGQCAMGTGDVRNDRSKVASLPSESGSRKPAELAK